VIDSQTRSLARVFFGRLFESEMFSSSMAAASGLLWILALIATPGVMFSFVMSLHYQELLKPRFVEVLARERLSHEALFVNVAIAVAAVAAALVWNSLTPDRRDAMVLGALPVTHRQQARARLMAIAAFIGLFILAMSGPTAVAFTIFTRAPTDLLEAPRHIFSHFVATGLGAAFAFFTLVNLQLILAATIGPRAVKLVTLPLQGLAIASVVAAFAMSDAMTSGFFAAFDGVIRPSLEWNPAAWFVGLYRAIGGDDRPIFAMLAERALMATAINLALVLVFYPIAYSRAMHHAIAAEGRRTTAASRAWATLASGLLRPFLRHPLQRGVAAFMIATLGRGQTHRFIVGIYAGIGFLISLSLIDQLFGPLTEDGLFAWFAIPLGYVFWLVCGMRVALMMPVEPSANWIFKLTEPVDKRLVFSTVFTVMLATTVLPIALAFSGAAMVFGYQRIAITLFLIVTLTGMCLIELLTMTMKMVPFSCTYLPGQLRLRIYWPIYFFLWLNIFVTLSNWCVWALESWGRIGQLAGGLLAVWIALRVIHLARIRKIRGFIYEELEVPAVAPSILGARSG
jgi:hypothetical protein